MMSACLTYTSICGQKNKSSSQFRLSLKQWSWDHSVPPIQNCVVASELEVQRNLVFIVAYNPKLSSDAMAASVSLPSKSQDPVRSLSICKGQTPLKYHVRAVQFTHLFSRMLTYSYGRQVSTTVGTSLMTSKFSGEALRLSVYTVPSMLYWQVALQWVE